MFEVIRQIVSLVAMLAIIVFAILVVASLIELAIKVWRKLK